MNCHYFFVIIFFVVCACDDSKKKLAINKTHQDYTSVHDSFKPIILSDKLAKSVKQWAEFRILSESLEIIEKGEFASHEKDSLEILFKDMEDIFYQNIYHQISDITEMLEVLENSIFPEEFNKKSIKSRILLLKTYVILLKTDMESPPYPTSDKLIAKLNNIHWSYEVLLKELNRVIQENSNNKTLEKIKNSKTFEILDSMQVTTIL